MENAAVRGAFLDPLDGVIKSNTLSVLIFGIL
jgi:hypothetical protein